MPSTLPVGVLLGGRVAYDDAPGRALVVTNALGDMTTPRVPTDGTESWGYDGAGRPLSTTLVSGTTTVFSQTATLDAAGQRVGLDESGGHTAYGYDAAGRLARALYPDGMSEQDQYDAAGNRLVVTSTDPLSGTSVTANGYDAADELLTRTTGLSATVYSYDGAGNQTGSVGPSGSTTNTFNDLGQLTQVSGPGTDARYVYDGQGDRLRMVAQGTPQGQDQTLAQDLATGGLTALASNGTQDYAYMEPGAGQAPLVGTNGQTGQSTYLGTDLLGSVRVAVDGSNTVIGAGTYDAWGNARLSTPGIVGLVQLAGLQAATPFGYAGQQYDAGSQTYAMRAREYSPQQGQFLSGDPHPSDPQAPVTIDPYQYAGHMPTQATDPSGQWYLPAGCDANGTCWFPGAGGLAEQAAEKSLMGMLQGQGAYAAPAPPPCNGCVGSTPGEGGTLSTANPALLPQSLMARLPGYFAFNVPVGRVKRCNDPVQTRFIANIWDPVTHQYWDIEKADVSTGSAQSGIGQVVSAIRTVGLLWPRKDQAANVTHCNSQGEDCLTDPSVPNQAYACGGDGVNYYDCYGAHLADVTVVPDAGATAGDGVSLDAYVAGSDYNPLTNQQVGAAESGQGIGKHHFYCTDSRCAGGYEWWVQARGLIEWRAYGAVPSDNVPVHYVAPLLNAIDFVLGGSLSAAQTCDGAGSCVAATAWLATNVEGVIPLAAGLAKGATALAVVLRSTGGTVIAATREALLQAVRTGKSVVVEVPLDSVGSVTRQVTLNAHDAETLLNDFEHNAPDRGGAGNDEPGVTSGAKPTGCGCFPGDTGVATPRGLVPIARLTVGALVLAEDPTSHVVEPEAVQAVIDDGIKPLMTVGLSDGSSLKVTTNHPFYVDSGPGIGPSQWVQAGDLQLGERLRTEDGQDVTIVVLRYHTGYAHVYTLTVAHDVIAQRGRRSMRRPAGAR